MGSGFSYVAETEVEHRNVAVYHDDVCKVRECPEVRQVVSGDAAGNAECSDEDAEQTENGDERSGTGNTVPGNFGEGNEAHDAGVCEEAEADGDHDHDKGLQEIRSQRMDGEQEFRIGACRFPFFRIQHPLVSHDDDEACHGADDVGIEEYAESGNDALFARMVRFSGSSCHRDGALAGFVRHESSLDALQECSTEDAAEDSFRLEGACKDGMEEVRNASQVRENEKDGRADVNDCHDRDKDICPAGNTLDAAKRHEGDEDKQKNRHDVVECRLQRNFLSANEPDDRAQGCDDVQALRRKAHERVEDIESRQSHAYPCLISAKAPCIERKAADEVVAAFFLEDLCERAFSEGCRHAEESGNPHPEERSRTAGSNRARDADHVARADAHSRRKEEGRQRRNTRVDASSRGKGPHARHELADLYESEAKCEINA